MAMMMMLMILVPTYEGRGEDLSTFRLPPWLNLGPRPARNDYVPGFQNNISILTGGDIFKQSQ